jgi:hypothetical protein
MVWNEHRHRRPQVGRSGPCGREENSRIDRWEQFARYNPGGALCRLVEEMFSDSLCAILFLDSDGKRLRKGIAASFPPEFMTAVDGVSIGPRVGSCGTAAYRKETIVN